MPHLPSLEFFSISDKFLRLAEITAHETASTNNQHVVISDSALTIKQYREQTKWSDHSVGLPILFCFYHGIELTLKGFLVAKNQKATGHQLTILLSEFQKAYPKTPLSTSISRYVRKINKRSPLGRFLKDNKITIDVWYEALKYPKSKKGQTFSHLSLRYGDAATIYFWRSLSKSAARISIQAVRLARSNKIA